MSTIEGRKMQPSNRYTNVYLRSHPFVHVIKDDFFSESLFKQLQSDFRILVSGDLEWTYEYGIQLSDGRKLNAPIKLTGGKDDLLGTAALIRQMRQFKSFNSLINLFSESRTYKDLFNLEQKIKIYDFDEEIKLFDYLRFKCVRLSLKISRTQPGAGIAIHRDSRDKLLAGLLYFGWTDEVLRNDGGTQIYELGADSQKLPLYDHDYFEHDKFRLVNDVQAVPNRFFGFVCSDKSWHGVRPATDFFNRTDEVYRDALQINLVYHRNYGSLLRLVRAVKRTFIRYSQFRTEA